MRSSPLRCVGRIAPAILWIEECWLAADGCCVFYNRIFPFRWTSTFCTRSSIIWIFSIRKIRPLHLELSRQAYPARVYHVNQSQVVYHAVGLLGPLSWRRRRSRAAVRPAPAYPCPCLLVVSPSHPLCASGSGTISTSSLYDRLLGRFSALLRFSFIDGINDHSSSEYLRLSRQALINSRVSLVAKTKSVMADAVQKVPARLLLPFDSPPPSASALCFVCPCFTRSCC